MARQSKLSGSLNTLVVIVATIGVAVLVNVLSASFFARADLTENELNSLSDTSVEAARALEDFEVKVYISKNLPETVKDPYGQDLVLRGIELKFRDKIEEYRAASGGAMKVTYVTKDVEDAAEKAKLQLFAGEEATAKEGRLEFTQYALGATFHYKSVMEVFPLALYPENYEFEITRALLRLKEKAEKSLLMKDSLRAGEELEEAVAACMKLIEDATPKEDGGPQNPFGLLTKEQSQAKIDAYRKLVPQLDQACKTPLKAPLEAARALKGKHRALDNVVVIADAFLQGLDEWSTALAGEEQQAAQALQFTERLKALKAGVTTEYETLVDSPGKKRIGFICAAKAFCPFPDSTPLIPQELQGVIGQKNPIAKQVAGALDQMTQLINQQLAQLEQGLFRRQGGFDIVRVDLDQDIPNDVEALVLFGAQSALSDYALYKIDQFVLSGRSLVVFLNEWDVSVYNLTPKGEPTVTALKKNASNIGQLLTHWGIKPNADLVVEPESHDKLRILERDPRFPWPVTKAYPYPLLPVLTEFDTSSPLVRAVSSITLPYASSVTIEPKQGVEYTELIKTSDKAGSTTDINFALDPMEQLSAAAGQTGAERVVAAVAQGTMSSYFAGKEAPAKPAAKPEEDKDEAEDVTPKAEKLESGPGRVLVIGSNLGLEDFSLRTMVEGFSIAQLTEFSPELITNFEQWRANFQNWDTRIRQIQHTLGDNLKFLFNALDWGIQQEGLVRIRSKQYQRRPLEPTDEGDQALIKVVAIGAMPMAFILVGVGLLFLRRARRRSLKL